MLPDVELICPPRKCDDVKKGADTCALQVRYVTPLVRLVFASRRSWLFVRKGSCGSWSRMIQQCKLHWAVLGCIPSNPGVSSSCVSKPLKRRNLQTSWGQGAQILDFPDDILPDNPSRKEGPKTLMILPISGSRWWTQLNSENSTTGNRSS